MAECRSGAATVTVAEVVARSGVSAATFATLFADREACVLAAFELAVDRAAACVLGPFQAESVWLDAVKAGLAAFIRFLEDEPALGRLLVFYSLGAGVEVQRRRVELLDLLAEAVDDGADQMPADRFRPPPVIAEGVVGAVLGIVQNRLLAEEDEPLIELFGQLVSIVVLPYLGSTVARRELVRPAPRARVVGEPSATARAAATRHVNARLTYRTARVMHAISDYPGASNREVASRAGIVDQGQVSKLLSRLEARGLVENAGTGRTRGAPNSWRVTEQGKRLLEAAES
jgi:AcrR family transcriptional regulator